MKTTSAIICGGAGRLERFARSCAALLALGALFAFAAPATSAQAQRAVVVNDLNMRTGPSTQYPVITVLRRGSPVLVHNCTRGSAWCNVSQRNATGWVSGRYLDFGGPVAPRRGGILPFISFEVETRGPYVHEARGYRDYREPAYRTSRRNSWSYGTPPRQGGIAPRSSVRTHVIPPPVTHDYDVALRRQEIAPAPGEREPLTRRHATEAAPAIETTPPRRTSRLGTPEMAEPQRLERRQE